MQARQHGRGRRGDGAVGLPPRSGFVWPLAGDGGVWRGLHRQHWWRVVGQGKDGRDLSRDIDKRLPLSTCQLPGISIYLFIHLLNDLLVFLFISFFYYFCSVIFILTLPVYHLSTFIIFPFLYLRIEFSSLLVFVLCDFSLSFSVTFTSFFYVLFCLLIFFVYSLCFCYFFPFFYLCYFFSLSSCLLSVSFSSLCLSLFFFICFLCYSSFTSFFCYFNFYTVSWRVLSVNYIFHLWRSSLTQLSILTDCLI